MDDIFAECSGDNLEFSYGYIVGVADAIHTDPAVVGGCAAAAPGPMRLARDLVISGDEDVSSVEVEGALL